MREFKFSRWYYRGLLSLAPWAIATVAVILWMTRYDVSQAQRPTTTVNVSRYQLFSGSFYGVINGQDSSETKGIFKIDTETGATWFYISHVNARGAVVGWAPIETLTRRQ